MAAAAQNMFFLLLEEKIAPPAGKNQEALRRVITKHEY